MIPNNAIVIDGKTYLLVVLPPANAEGAVDDYTTTTTPALRADGRQERPVFSHR